MNIIKYINYLLIFILPMATLNGCMSLVSTSSQKETTEINVILMSDPDINEDILGIASPVRLTFLQLNSEIQFRQLPQIASDDKPYDDLLKGAMLEQTQVMLRPDELLEFKLPLNEKTKYLGVVTAYRNESYQWKSSLQKQEKYWYQLKDNNFLYLHIQSQGVAQLSKQEALKKILDFKLKDQEENLEEFKKLTKRKQDKVIKKLEKALEKPTPSDISKGYFLTPDESKVDMNSLLKPASNVADDTYAEEK